jgi:O-antigen/teichoic acid export membrane protein
MSTQNNVIKAGMGYTIANILIKSIGFLSLPLFTRLLTTEEYGLFSVFIAYDAILFPIMGFALHTSIRKANYEFPGAINDYISSISLLYLGNLALFSSIALIFGGYLYQWLELSTFELVLLVLYAFGKSVITLYNYRISLDYNYKKYMVIAGAQSIGSIGLSALLMVTVFSNDKFVGRIIGDVIILTAISIYIFYYFFRKSKPRFNKNYWKFGLKFSLPVVPHGISQVLLAQFDRIMIKSMVGASEAGIFGFTSSIKIVLTVITDSINTVWSTWFFAEMDKGNISNIQKRAGQLVIFYTMLTVGLLSISPELLKLLGSSDYWDGKYVVIPMVLDAFLLFIYGVIVQGEYYEKRTDFVLLGTIGATVINIFFNLIFIRKYGYIAAAYTTLFAYVCYLVFHMISSKYLVKFYIVKVRYILFALSYVAVFSIFCLFLIDVWSLRWLIMVPCELILVVVLFRKLKNDGDLDMLLRQFRIRRD